MAKWVWAPLIGPTTSLYEPGVRINKVWAPRHLGESPDEQIWEEEAIPQLSPRKGVCNVD